MSKNTTNKICCIVTYFFKIFFDLFFQCFQIKQNPFNCCFFCFNARRGSKGTFLQKHERKECYLSYIRCKYYQNVCFHIILLDSFGQIPLPAYYTQRNYLPYTSGPACYLGFHTPTEQQTPWLYCSCIAS